METTATCRPQLRLTSAADGAQPSRKAIDRALTQQHCSIHGAYVRALDLVRSDNEAALQYALAEELQRLTTEAFDLADALESLPAATDDEG